MPIRTERSTGHGTGWVQERSRRLLAMKITMAMQGIVETCHWEVTLRIQVRDMSERGPTRCEDLYRPSSTGARFYLIGPDLKPLSARIHRTCPALSVEWLPVARAWTIPYHPRFIDSCKKASSIPHLSERIDEVPTLELPASRPGLRRLPGHPHSYCRSHQVGYLVCVVSIHELS